VTAGVCHSERSEESGDGIAQYYVYIMTNRSDTLYTGVTNNLERRVYEHKHGLAEEFTKKHNLTMLVYYETTDDVRSAITREKQIKGWLRSRKIALIESANPQWRDLSEGWNAPLQTLRFAQGDRE
jgi:putative endonuclease